MPICYSSNRNAYALSPMVRSVPGFSRVGTPCGVFTRKQCRLASGLRDPRKESEGMESRWAAHAGSRTAQEHCTQKHCGGVGVL